MLIPLTELWLPILLSGVAVFIASSVIHMASPMHKKDYGPLPDEAAVLVAMRDAGVQRGAYVFPHAGSMKEMGDPAFIERQKLGPVGFLQVLPNGPIRMGGMLGIWFVYSLVIALFAGYVGTLALGRGAAFDEVFQVTGTVAVLGFAFSSVEDSIWKGVSWGTTFRFVVDGVIYGLLTAAVFGWLWPGA